MDDRLTQPLRGYRVVDCTRGTAGPRASGLLADYGAEVIWVEPPGGDPYREKLKVQYSVFNRNKRSVVLDLKTPAWSQWSVRASRHRRRLYRELAIWSSRSTGSGLLQAGL